MTSLAWHVMSADAGTRFDFRPLEDSDDRPVATQSARRSWHGPALPPTQSQAEFHPVENTLARPTGYYLALVQSLSVALVLAPQTVECSHNSRVLEAQ